MEVMAARYTIAFQPVSFQTLAKATIGQKYDLLAKKLIGPSRMPQLVRSSLIIPVEERASWRMPVTMIQDRKCGR